MDKPASLPGNQTLRIAGTVSLSSTNVKGLPVNSTKTTGFPVFNKACNKSF